MVMPKIELFRGLEATIPTLDEAVPAFTEDTKTLFIGSDSGNIKFPNKDDLLAELAGVNADAELVSARGTYPTLGPRLDNVDSSLLDSANKSNFVGIKQYSNLKVAIAGGYDWSAAIAKAIADAKVSNKKIVLHADEVMYITQPIVPDVATKIVGFGKFGSTIQLVGAITGIDLSSTTAKTGVEISSIGIIGTNTTGQIGIDGYYVTNGSNIRDIRIENMEIGLRISKCWYGAFSTIFIRNCLSYGLHIKNPTGAEQVNAITFKEMYIQGCYNSVYLQSSNTSANIRFDACTFEASRKTSVVTEEVSPLSFVNCYFERNYTDAYLGTEVLIPTNPIDVKLGTLSTRNVVKFDSCYFARNNNFTASTGKASIYCDATAKVIMDACQFSCNTGGYIDYNIYSDSTIPVDFHNCTEDGYAKTFYSGVQKNTIVAFVAANDLRYTSQVSFYGQINKKGHYYLQFIPKDTVTVATRPFMKLYNAFTNAQIGSDLSFPLSYTANTLVEYDLGVIDPATVSLVNVAQTIPSDVDVNGMTLLIYKEPQPQ